MGIMNFAIRPQSSWGSVTWVLIPAAAVLVPLAVGVSAGWLPTVLGRSTLLLALALSAVAACSLIRRQSPLPGEGDRGWNWLWVSIGLAVAGVGIDRWLAAEINAVDFTVFFDRPIQRLATIGELAVEEADSPSFSWRSQFAVHGFWILIPVSWLYHLMESPLWLHALTGLCVAMGAFHLARAAHHLGAGPALAVATGIALAGHDSTARAVNYGFHPELFYLWAIAWMLDAGLAGRRLTFACAVLMAVSVKEDAFMPVTAAAIGLALHRWRAMSWSDRAWFLAAPVLIGGLSLIAFQKLAMRHYLGSETATYAWMWSHWGPTQLQAVLGMLVAPHRVLAEVYTSGIWKVLTPTLILPLLGWRWCIGIVPVLVLYALSACEPMRTFTVYYGAMAVPFLVLASAAGIIGIANCWPDRASALRNAGAMLLVGSCLIGGGYMLRPIRSETTELAKVLARLDGPTTVHLQGALLPHAGYDRRFQLLNRRTMQGDGIVVIAPGLNPYPLQREELLRLVQNSTVVAASPSGRVLALRFEGGG